MRLIVGMRGNGNEVRRQRLNVTQPAWNAQQKVFRGVVEPREGADGVAGVSPHPEFADSPDVDCDTHSLV